MDPAYKSAPSARTYEVTLGHNSLVLMNAGCQERYKHTSVYRRHHYGTRVVRGAECGILRVPTQKALDLFRPAFDLLQEPIPPDQQTAHTSRINITFRFYREGKRP